MAEAQHGAKLLLFLMPLVLIEQTEKLKTQEMNYTLWNPDFSYAISLQWLFFNFSKQLQTETHLFSRCI